MGVAGGNPLHNGAVCDAQIADAVDPQLDALLLTVIVFVLSLIRARLQSAPVNP
jgi:hypothetical protein